MGLACISLYLCKSFFELLFYDIARKSVHVEVKLKEGKVKAKEERTCEVIMRLPNEVFTVSETTINMFAAVDIVEEKLKKLLHKYKEMHASPKLRQRLMARLKRQSLLA